MFVPIHWEADKSIIGEAKGCTTKENRRCMISYSIVLDLIERYLIMLHYGCPFSTQESDIIESITNTEQAGPPSLFQRIWLRPKGVTRP